MFSNLNNNINSKKPDNSGYFIIVLRNKQTCKYRPLHFVLTSAQKILKTSSMENWWRNNVFHQGNYQLVIMMHLKPHPPESVKRNKMIANHLSYFMNLKTIYIINRMTLKMFSYSQKKLPL